MSTTTTDGLPLHTHKHSLRTPINRLFVLIYCCAILALLYHHTLSLLHSATMTSFFITLTLLISDSILAFLNITTQAFRMKPIYRKEYPENLKRILRKADFPALDVFICTADPYKEPPMNVVNTALSVMGYDYPTEKVSVYVSDDGGSALTLFAFMEAAKFARHWLPFCRENNIVERCPEAFFQMDYSRSSEAEEIKIMYQGMKVRVDNVIERGKVDSEYVTGEWETQAFSKWIDGFTQRDHPTVIQVLADSSKDRDITDNVMPNLIYVSREKSRKSEHNFKAGALNVLIRVSAVMTNAPIVLTQDCDMYSNDPQTPSRALCYLSDPKLGSKLGYVQFPQRFRGINKNDIYGCEHKSLFVINPEGMDGFSGPSYVGTGCFFNRRVFFGGPSQLLSPEIPELAPDNVVDKPIRSTEVLELAHSVAACNYENNTDWGWKIGVRYGSLVEDYFTGYRLQCEGWKSVFCNPARAAFYGDAPINLVDVLSQTKRWTIGLLEVAFSKYSPITFGIRSMGLLMGLSYAHYAFWPIWSIPITVYAFLPQLALLNGINIFPKVSEPWFLLYVFLFIGSYIQNCLDFVVEGGTFPKWWNDQRMWMIRALSSFLFGSIEYLLMSLGISTHGFNVTSKVLDEDQSKRYDQGIFEFGVASPMFVPLTSAAIVNLAAFAWGHVEAFKGSNDLEGMFLQMFIAGFGVVNCIPIYEAIISRSDKGRIPTKTIMVSLLLAFSLYVVAYVAL
ncbi:putative cellulose synthase (UDP-forming) [Rosa chinensis]|uniref:Putative cellulose synthase (UDP-forming) n=1 Tax=Rosa chinensis TaxID=74649 RepID=A0A2P6P3X7_ROSCH|nr:cellulose synthase-like protein G3 [Rosa chinensis]PRQ16612.1 putative cellulose synthase (UDP-forming) [Rosa chinensis]